MRPLLPRFSLRGRVAFANNLGDRVLPGPESPISEGVPGAHRASMRSGSFASVLRPDRRLARAPCQGQSESLAYVDYTPHRIPHSKVGRSIPRLAGRTADSINQEFTLANNLRKFAVNLTIERCRLSPGHIRSWRNGLRRSLARRPNRRSRAGRTSWPGTRH